MPKQHSLDIAYLAQTFSGFSQTPKGEFMWHNLVTNSTFCVRWPFVTCGAGQNYTGLPDMQNRLENIMKNILSALIIAILSLCPGAAQAQDDSLSPENTRIHHSFYAGPLFTYSWINSHSGFLGGARAGWIIHSQFSIGAYGAWQVNAVRGDPPSNDIQMYYYGGSLDWIILPMELVHGGLSLLGGMGTIYRSGNSTLKEDFPMVEPQWFFEGNLTSWLRVDLSLGYRWALGTDRLVYSFWDGSGPTCSLLFKFGNFHVEPYTSFFNPMRE